MALFQRATSLIQNPIGAFKSFFETDEERRKREEEEKRRQEAEGQKQQKNLFVEGTKRVIKAVKEEPSQFFLPTSDIIKRPVQQLQKNAQASREFQKQYFQTVTQPKEEELKRKTEQRKTTIEQQAGQLFQGSSLPSRIGKQVFTGLFAPAYKTPEERQQAAAETVINYGGAAPFGKTATQQIVKRFANKFTKEDVKLIGKFAEIVETGKGKGNLGQLGDDIQILAKNVFGKDSTAWGNQRLKNAFDLVLGKIGQRPNRAGLGLQAQNIREGLKTPINEFEEASKYIRTKIGRSPEGLPPSGVVTKARNAVSILKEKLVDSFSPIEDTINVIERQGKFRILPTADPRLLRNRVLGSTDIAKQMIKRELEPVIKTVGSKNLDLFDQYLGARQAIDVSKRGVKTGIDTKKAQVFVDNLAPQFDDAANQVTSFTQKVLKYVQEGGLISKEGYAELLKRYPRYVPLNRIFDAIEEVSQTGPSQRAVASLSKQTIVQKLVGSERDIQSPLSSIINKTMDATRQVEVNRVAQSITNLGKLPQFKDVIKPATAESRNTISTFINGQKQLFEVPEGFANAAKNLNKETTNILVKTLAIPVRTARLGFTGVNLPFVATNLVRDQLFANLTTTKVAKTSIANPYNWGKSLFDVIKQGGAYDDFLASGGGWSTFFQVGRDQGKETVKQLARSNKSKVLISITNPTKWLSAIEDVVSRGEQATRTQQFRGMRQTPNVPVDPFTKPTAELLKAVKAGRETTVDFGKGGAYKGVLNSVFIYLNAGIQGSRTMFRAFQQHPIGTSMKLISTLYIPVAAATLWNTATPERKAAYQDIDDYERNKNIIILPPNPQKDEDGNYIDAIKIPLPQSFGALTIPIRTAIEHLADGNPESIAQALMDTLGEALPIDISSKEKLVSRITPTALLPGIEDVTNTKLFTGTPIVPRAKQELPAEMQTRFDTSGFIKKVGEALNYSPAKIQNYVQSYSGGVGLQVLNVIDRGMAKAGIIKEEEIGGRGMYEDLKRRFTQASSGKIDEQFFQETKGYKEEAAVRSAQEKEAAQSIYDELQNIPKEQWVPKLSQLKTDKVLNERIYDRIIELNKDIKAGGVTTQEKSLRSLPVIERSKYILNQLSEIDQSEQRAYLSDLKKKRILSEEVYKALIETGYKLPK